MLCNFFKSQCLLCSAKNSEFEQTIYGCGKVLELCKLRSGKVPDFASRSFIVSAKQKKTNENEEKSYS